MVLNQDEKPVAGAQIVVLPSNGKLRAATGVRDENRRARRRNGGAAALRRRHAGRPTSPAGMLGFAANLGCSATARWSRRATAASRSARRPAAATAGFHRDYAWGGSQALELAAGKCCEGVLVTMHTGGGLEGNVTDRHGRPLAQAIVAAFSPGAFGGGSANSGGLYQGETDAKGDYTIKHVTAGSYFVVVTRGDAELNHCAEALPKSY